MSGRGEPTLTQVPPHVVARAPPRAYVGLRSVTNFTTETLLSQLASTGIGVIELKKVAGAGRG